VTIDHGVPLQIWNSSLASDSFQALNLLFSFSWVQGSPPLPMRSSWIREWALTVFFLHHKVLVFCTLLLLLSLPATTSAFTSFCPAPSQQLSKNPLHLMLVEHQETLASLRWAWTGVMLYQFLFVTFNDFDLCLQCEEKTSFLWAG
jgi:hypothetical protein